MAGPTRVPIFVPIAQSTERARPKRQVAGESPAGDSSFLRVWFNSRMRPCQGRDNGAIPFTRSISVGSVAHQQSARLTCERQRGQHSPLPPFFRGHSSVSRAGASHAPGRRRDSSLTISSLWCSPDNMPASHAGDHRSEAGQGHQFTSPSKHCQRCVRSVSE